MNEKYQGWTNYETWGVNLVMANDEAQHTYWGARARALKEQAAEEQAAERDEWTEDEHVIFNEYVIFELAGEIKEHVESITQNANGHDQYSQMMISQLLGAALARVDWHEIAKVYAAS